VELLWGISQDLKVMLATREIFSPHAKHAVEERLREIDVTLAAVRPDNHPDAAAYQGKKCDSIVEDDIKLPLLGSNQDSPDPEAGDKDDHVG